MRRRELLTGFWRRNVRERDHFEKLDEGIILNWISGNIRDMRGLDLSGPG
jgi:hypothetical protein